MRVATTELFIAILWFVLVMRVLLSTSVTDFVIEIITFFVALVVGFFVIRGVMKEIENREKGERLARYLANANARLRNLDKQKTEFISIASHQLRGPIAAIVGYAALIDDGSYGAVPKALKEPISRIFQSGKRISIMVDDFLNVTRIEQGRMSYNLIPCDLKQMVCKVVGEMRVIGEKEGLDIQCVDDKKKAIYVAADESKLSQVFSNLIDNAIKYTEKGFVKVEIKLDSSGKRALVSFTDSGIGIDPEEVHDLFQKFNRASNANSVSVYGAGLGLYIAREIIKAHEGWIHISSPGIGKGSTFTVELPAVDAPTEEVVAQ